MLSRNILKKEKKTQLIRIPLVCAVVEQRDGTVVRVFIYSFSVTEIFQVYLLTILKGLRHRLAAGNVICIYFLVSDVYLPF